MRDRAGISEVRGSDRSLEERPLTVKLGSSRQVMIPKRIYDQVGLVPGDFLEVELHAGKIVYTPKVLVDKDQGE